MVFTVFIVVSIPANFEIDRFNSLLHAIHHLLSLDFKTEMTFFFKFEKKKLDSTWSKKNRYH